ncbi:MAG TPA: ankyrin repeat domain-containing protein [Fimbriimonadaceae bacterium]|nr:ankyrin repeat domain-containing protein [Fimbriimonadaceae bacterium]
MSKQLPQQPSLEHLKNEAKALLRLLRESFPEAKLAEAQRDVAREYGFSSWSRLKRAVEGYADQRTALVAAIRAGDRIRVSRLLDENPLLIESRDPDSFGAPPILAAAHRNDIPMLELLLSRGADIDGRSDWWAGSFGALDFTNDEASAFLLSRGATLTAHAAARLGKAEELRRLIARDPSVMNERGGDGQYPLHFAKTAEIVDILLDAGAEIDARDLDHEGTPAQTRVLDSEVLKRLVERGASTDIFMAIVLDDLDLVRKHLADDPEALERSVDEPGNPMIPQAPGRHIYTYNIGFARPIQVSVNLERWRLYDYLFALLPPSSQLLAACWKGDREAAEDVLARHPEAIAEARERHARLPGMAAKFPRPHTLALMLALGFDPNVQDGEGFAPIHWAAFHGRPDLIEIILPYGPDLELRNVYGGTVLGTSCYGSLYGWSRAAGDYARTAELLIEAGAKAPEHASGSQELMAVLRRTTNL